MQSPKRDHLFISYAYEDAPLADWLVRRLTAAGYRVWCDRFKLLGGESYPRDIDNAIKLQAFRVIALLSKYSLEKPNPTKERTLALNLARERREDFLIPINVDGLRAVDLDWMTSDLTFISFSENWAAGIAQLLKKLASINAPRPLHNGPQVAAATFIQDSVISNKEEVLHSNFFPIFQIPEVIRRFRFVKPINGETRLAVSKMWPVFFTDPTNALAFSLPKKLPDEVTVKSHGGSAWRYEDRINRTPSRNVVSALIKKEFLHYCLSKGLSAAGAQEVYFPPTFLDGRIHFTNWDGRRTWVKVVGRRSAWRPGKPAFEYQYHLSLRFALTEQFGRDFLLQLRLGLHITDTLGQPLPTRTALARRKAICRSWWNDAWLKRTIAVSEFLSSGHETITIGPPGEQLVIRSSSLQFTVPVGIDEDSLLNVPVDDPANDRDMLDELVDLDGEIND